MYFMNDIEMYHAETNTPFIPQTSTINEDCGQVSYIFSDKTGTLTDNTMLFRKLSVAGQAWLHVERTKDPGLGKLKKEKMKRKHRRRVGAKGKGLCNSRKSMGDVVSPQPPSATQGSLRRNPSMQLSTPDLLGYLRARPHTFFSRKARFFMLSLALCHTCLPEVAGDGTIDYQAASPDELALVRAAQELGYIVTERQFDTITIKTFPHGAGGEPLVEIYEILDVIEFSSRRKRMSVIIRLPNGKICIFSKGADSTMIELLRLREVAKKKARDVERRASVRRSLEAQEVIRRNSIHRTSIGGGRPSIGGSRASMNLSRLKPIHDDLDEWLREREGEKDGYIRSRRSGDDDRYHSRPFAVRHSITFGNLPDRRPRDADDGSDGDGGDDGEDGAADAVPAADDDDYDAMVDEEASLDDARVFERCFAHVDQFATEGLRTLLYGHRFVDEQEYQTWKDIYAEATTSLVDRTAMVERAAEIIERDFDLTGATAIEDKLQEGVPGAIEKLRRAGIKLWMLTGDKRETAVNVGHACRLIRDYSTVTILSLNDVGISETITSAIAAIDQQKVAHSVVVVDGGTLAAIEADETLWSLFFEIAVLTDSVICCRASPSQKANLVKTIRTKLSRSITLAIGDGANDIAMIQEAHVGVGITGKEGLQAARVSDYSMAQFRFLLKFLLVHGRWNYVRTTKYTVCTFWKVFVFLYLLVRAPFLTARRNSYSTLRKQCFSDGMDIRDPVSTSRGACQCSTPYSPRCQSSLWASLRRICRQQRCLLCRSSTTTGSLTGASTSGSIWAGCCWQPRRP